MECSNCHYDFCWCCMGPQRLHDGCTLYLMPCPNLPFNIWLNLLITLAFVIFIPVVFALGPTCAAIYWLFATNYLMTKACRRKCEFEKRSCAFVLVYLLLLLFVSIPLILPFFLLFAAIVTAVALPLGTLYAYYAVLFFLISLTIRGICSQCF